MGALAAWAVIAAALVFMSVLLHRQIRLSRDGGGADTARRQHVSVRGQVIWVTSAGPGQLGLDSVLAVRSSDEHHVCVPVHVVVGTSRPVGVGEWMAGLVEQWASTGQSLSVELLYSSRFEARAKVWQESTSIVLDVLNPVVVRESLRRSAGDLADL